jgi:hypothetical protein
LLGLKSQAIQPLNEKIAAARLGAPLQRFWVEILAVLSVAVGGARGGHARQGGPAQLGGPTQHVGGA